MRIAIVGAGVAGSYLLNRIPSEHQAECFEMRPQDKWYTVCAWGTSAPYISDLVKMAGLNFEDYIMHKGRRMLVDTGRRTVEIKLSGLVTYDKHRLCEDMLKGHKVNWGKQIKSVNGTHHLFDDFDAVVDCTGVPRSLLPRIKNDLMIPCVEYQVKSKEFPWDDFYIKPYPSLTGYLWFFPLGDGVAHIGAGDLHGSYKNDLDEFLKKYHCEVIRKIGRPVRIVPPAYCQPFSEGKVVGVGESIGTVYPLLGEGIIPSMQCVNMFVDHFPDIEGYSEEVLKHFDIYAKVYRLVRAKLKGNFSPLKQFPELISLYMHMRSNERRYGLETKLTDLLKVVRV